MISWRKNRTRRPIPGRVPRVSNFMQKKSQSHKQSTGQVPRKLHSHPRTSRREAIRCASRWSPGMLGAALAPAAPLLVAFLAITCILFLVPCFLFLGTWWLVLIPYSVFLVSCLLYIACTCFLCSCFLFLGFSFLFVVSRVAFLVSGLAFPVDCLLHIVSCFPLVVCCACTC